MSVIQLYEQALDSLAPADRLRLATMLLETVSPSDAVDDSDEWSEEDLRDFAAHSQRNLTARFGEEPQGDDPAAG